MVQEEKKVTEETIEQELSLNDDRRVKVLSPGALVAKRFFRNRLAVVGLTMLVVMFVLFLYRRSDKALTDRMNSSILIPTWTKSMWVW